MRWACLSKSMCVCHLYMCRSWRLNTCRHGFTRGNAHRCSRGKKKEEEKEEEEKKKKINRQLRRPLVDLASPAPPLARTPHCDFITSDVIVCTPERRGWQSFNMLDLEKQRGFRNAPMANVNVRGHITPTTPTKSKSIIMFISIVGSYN